MNEPKTPDSWDDRQMHGSGDLALFLGGSEDSFTGLLLTLISKAQATPANMSRLKLAFPREVQAWKTWMSMDPAPTFKELREALDSLDEPARRGLEMLRQAAANADPEVVARMKAHVEAQYAAIEPELLRQRELRAGRVQSAGIADPDEG